MPFRTAFGRESLGGKGEIGGGKMIRGILVIARG